MRKILKYWASVVVGIVALACVITVCWSVTSLKKVSRSRVYRISYFHTETNEVKTGLVNIPKALDQGSEISYLSSDGKVFSTISSTLGEDFECTGSCFCESGSMDRRVANVLGLNLYLIVPAVSLFVAHRIAGDYMNQKCRNQFEGECSSVDIRSEVDSCQFKDEETTVEDSQVKAEEEVFGHRAYKCSGHCVPSNKLKNPVAIEKQQELDCTELEMKNIEVQVPQKAPGSSKQWKAGYQNRVARRKFLKDHMREFCKLESRQLVERTQHRFKTNSKTGEKTGPYLYSKIVKVSLCVAMTAMRKEQGMYEGQNVECTMIYSNVPRFKGDAEKVWKEQKKISKW